MELTINHLTKSYDGGKTLALNDFTKTFYPGVYGLLGTVNLEHARYKRIQAYSGGEI